MTKTMAKAVMIPLLAGLMLMAGAFTSQDDQNDGGLMDTATSVIADVVETVGLETEAAAATPRWCWEGYVNTRNAYSECSGGTGHHRVHVWCENNWGWGGHWRSGPVRTVTRESWVSCPWGTSITWVGHSKW